MADSPLPPPGPSSPSDADPDASPDRAELPAGIVGSRYEIREELGRGAMAVVYRARDRTVDVEVALKVLSIAASDRSGRIARVRRELKAAWKVTHPGVVRLYDLIERDDKVAISMEWVEGETLAARLKREPRLDATELLQLAVDLADALAAAHEAGVIHRDLKPANIILRARTHRPVITDFGVSRLASIDEPAAVERDPTREAPSVPGRDPRLTQSGTMIGTPMYMAPEQLAASGNVGPAADVYALGLVLYEAATGALPASDTARSLLEQRRDARPPSVATLRPDLPAALVRAIDDALEPAPLRRIADGAALRVRLRGRMSGRRKRWLAAAVGVAALVAVAAGLYTRGALRNRLPAHDRRVAFVVDNLGAREDDWLAAVLERAARHSLSREELRVRAVERSQQPNVIVRLGFHRDGDVLHLGGDVRATGSDRPQPLAEMEGESVAKLLERLLPQLQTLLVQSQAERPPNAAEAKEMRERGVTSFHAYLDQERAIFEAFASVNTDIARVEAATKAAIAAEPGWADPYVLQAIIHRDSESARDALARAQKTQSPGRGRALLDAAAVFVSGRYQDAIPLLQPLNYADAGDEMVAWMLATALVRQHRVEEAVAVERAAHARHPDLQFGADLENDLRALGRQSEVAEVQSRWMRVAPDAEQPLSAQITFDLEAHQVARAVVDTRRLLIVHGSDTRKGLLCDVLIVADRLPEAATVANDMVTVPGQEGADGWLRVGQIATLQGRFAAAFDAYARAAKEGRPSGDQGPTVLALLESQDLGERTGVPSEVQRALAETVTYFEATMRPDQLAYARFERKVAQVASGGEQCPDLTSLLRDAALSPPPRVWLRTAAAGGCAACRDVVARGRDLSEQSMSSLFQFGQCALAEHAWQLAADAFADVQRVRTQSTDLVPTTATASAVMARYQRGRALEALRQPKAARAAYGDFLAHWGHADRRLPEVDAAYRSLARLDAKR